MNVIVTDMKIATEKWFHEILTDYYAIISITTPLTPDDYTIPKTKFTTETLKLKFDDVRKQNIKQFNLSGTFVLFDETLAKRVIDFVLRTSHAVNNIVVHCEGGISRSPGIAWGLKDIFGDKIKIYTTMTTTLNYNKHVRQVLKHTYDKFYK